MEAAELYRFPPLRTGEVAKIAGSTWMQHVKLVLYAYRQARLNPRISDGPSYPGFSTDECEFQISLSSADGAIEGTHFILRSPVSDRKRVDYVNEGDIFAINGYCDFSVGRIKRPIGRETWIAHDYALNTGRVAMMNEFMDDHLAQGHFKAVKLVSRLLLPIIECYQ